MPVTPLHLVGEPLTEKVIVEDRVFLLRRPSDSDRTIRVNPTPENPQGEVYLPFWADLWPAARMLAKVILREAWPPGLHALEIGCGLGLAGIAALAKGIRITFSDHDVSALHYASENARLNGFEDFELLPMDWRYPPAGRRFPLILAADLLYAMANLQPVLALIREMLEPDGVCLLTDTDRLPLDIVRDALADNGLDHTTSLVRAGEPGGRRMKGTLYRITLRPGTCLPS